MRDEVVVEVEVLECRRQAGEALDVLDTVLTEAETRYLLESFEAESRDGADAGVGNDDLVCLGVFAIE